MRKIAAHFWFRPDGTVGKYPIISFNEDNYIIDIRERGQFEEESGLELFNGLLLPAFIDNLPDVVFKEDELSLKKYLNKQFIDGTRILGVNKVFFEQASALFFKGIEFVSSSSVFFENDNLNTAFKKIVNIRSCFIEELQNYTMKNAFSLGVHDVYGTLEVGKKPGLLAISNVNYKTLDFSVNTKLKNIL